MKAIIDRNGCISCGTCWDTCPAFFEQNADDSLSQVIEKFRLGNNPAEGFPTADLDGCVREAADLCPAQVISTGE
jgi:ferredoxin